MLAHVIDFLEDQSGASSMEYALLAAFVSVIIAGSLSTVGSDTFAALAVTSNGVEQIAYDTCVRTAEDITIC